MKFANGGALILAVVLPVTLSAHPQADTVFLGGKVITVDASDTVAQALAVAGERILAVGTDAEIRHYVGPETRIIELRGRALTPGLIDTHFHMDGNGVYEVNAAYPAARSIADIVEQVRQKVAMLKTGEWVLGRGWDEGKLAEQRYVHARDLDAVAPANPVFLSHATGHYAVVNTAALKLAGISRDTPDPPAGTIDRDGQGNPTGVLKERATALVLKLAPPYTDQQQRAGFVRVMSDLNRNGMTAIKDPGVSAGKWDIYREMLGAGELRARTFVLWETKGTTDDATALVARVASFTRPYEPAHNDGHLIAGGVKLFLDGSGGARTAWMNQEWSRDYTATDTGNFGYPLIEPQTYREIVRIFNDAGIHIGTHAIGDRAIDLAVDTYAEALRKHPIRGLRHAIIHANIPTPHAIDTMAALQRLYDAGYPESQAGFLWWIGDIYAGNFGRARDPRLMPFKTYLDRHIIWAGGSDYDVTPLSAMDGIWASVSRQTLLGTYGKHPFGTSQAVDVHAALRSYTIWAAHQLFLENRVGSLEPGKEADIAVWSRDIYSIPAAELREVKCEMTLLAGRVVFGDS